MFLPRSTYLPLPFMAALQFMVWLTENRATADPKVTAFLSGLPLGQMWMAVGAFTLGLLLQDSYNPDSWIRRGLRQFGQFVLVSSPRKQTTSDGHSLYADLTFTRHAKNIVILVETFRAEIQFVPPGRLWVRCGAVTPLKREDCNKGATEAVKLIEIRRNPQLPSERPANADLKVRVSVTAAGRDACVKEFQFWWYDTELHIMPREAASIANGGDANDFKDEGVVLWV